MFSNFQNLLASEKSNIKFRNPKISNIFQAYSFYYIEQKMQFDENQQIFSNIKKSNAIVINHYQIQSSGKDDIYFIFGFEETIIIIHQSNLLYANLILLINPDIQFCFIENTRNIFDQFNSVEYKESTNIRNEHNFQKEIYNFNKQFLSKNSKFWKIIIPCITGYLIKQSYLKWKFLIFAND